MEEVVKILLQEKAKKRMHELNDIQTPRSFPGRTHLPDPDLRYELSGSSLLLNPIQLHTEGRLWRSVELKAAPDQTRAKTTYGGTLRIPEYMSPLSSDSFPASGGG